MSSLDEYIFPEKKPESSGEKLSYCELHGHRYIFKNSEEVWGEPTEIMIPADNDSWSMTPDMKSTGREESIKYRRDHFRCERCGKTDYKDTEIDRSTSRITG